MRRTQLQFIKENCDSRISYPGLYKDETEYFDDGEAMRIFYEDVFRSGTLGHWNETTSLALEIEKFIEDVDHISGKKSRGQFYVPEERTFDQALDYFLRANRLVSILAIDSFKVDLSKKVKRLEGKLPYQVRIFRR